MEKFIDYYHWVENKKVRYARMKLIGRADLEMNDALLRNYLPPTYRSSLLEWDRLKQGTAPVAEYIEKFKEFKRRI